MPKIFMVALVMSMFTIGSVFAGEKSAFSSLDTDGDGFISKTEAAANEGLSSAWSQVDADMNEKLDESEFSAFETKEMPATDSPAK